MKEASNPGCRLRIAKVSRLVGLLFLSCTKGALSRFLEPLDKQGMKSWRDHASPSNRMMLLVKCEAYPLVRELSRASYYDTSYWSNWYLSIKLQKIQGHLTGSQDPKSKRQKNQSNSFETFVPDRFTIFCLERYFYIPDTKGIPLYY